MEIKANASCQHQCGWSQIQYNNNMLEKMKQNWEEGLKREDNWKKYPYLFNRTKDLNFECECGKKYASFPGLYLHFQRKHDQKISMKPEQHECQITKTELGTNYTYWISKKRQSKEESPSNDSFIHMDQLKATFCRYLDQNSKILAFDNQDDGIQLKLNPMGAKSILKKFQFFLRKQVPVNQLDNVMNFSPQYFNFFILSLRREEDHKQREERNICEILIQFWKWLRAEELTEFIVEYLDEKQEERKESKVLLI